MKWFFRFGIVFVAAAVSIVVAHVLALSKFPPPHKQGTTTMRGMYITHMRMNEGDDPSWAAQDFNDSNWEVRDLRSLRQTPGIVWARQNFLVWPEYIEGKVPAAIFVEGGVSTEIYFNGAFVGRNGNPSNNPSEEKAGNIDAKFFVPSHLFHEGNNVLAVRFSSSLPWQERYEFNIGIRFEAYGSEREKRISDYLPSLLLIGAIGAAALYFATRYALTRDDRSTLWLALLLFCAVTQFAAELVRGLYSYPYPWHVLRMSTITLMATLSGFFLNLLVAEKFNDISKIGWPTITALSVTLIIAIRFYGQDHATYFVLLVSIAIAMSQSAWAAFRRQKNAATLLAGLLLFSLAFLVPMERFLDGIYYYAMSAFAGVLFIWRAIDHEATRRKAESAEATSNRLKLDLLKKQLQPHFIMNTLMALSEWIVESPATGIKMIQALAAEFRLLHAMSDKNTVSIEEELALCQAHLEVMSFRRDQTFELETELQDRGAELPPATLHTLLENAITHNRYAEKTIVFHICQKTRDNQHFYEIRTPIGHLKTPEKQNSGDSGGLGLGYIAARLAHIWGKRATLESGQEGNYWVSRIHIPMERA